ncbi:UDP-forming cellulose synthase catalytic subunit [Terriglobus roseus]|nr:UDP-forming cellulose synthase catalytic subunit [Terriglobus roseus]
MPLRIFRFFVACACTFVLFQFVSLYMSWSKQVIFGSLTVLVAMAINRTGKSRLFTIALMLLSIAATLRYGWWRIRMVVGYFSDDTNHRFSIDAVLMLVLLSAEVYTVAIMVLGYMQTSQRLQRRPVPLPADEALWPHVDVLIPTYNEPLSLVRYTALAAINIDYPPEKLHVYILDDGTRQEFRDFAAEAGVGYVVREKHNHAKAGNINHALTKMSSPLVSIFDCDHVPTRSFLQMTVGWFLVEEKLAMMQTPHFFYSPDPFERNLLQYNTIPNEGELFYGIIQDGNDLWNATFFCGSCAVIRRTALEEVGGIAVETVTEDAHTSLRMQKKGWNTGYMNIAQAAGLATETLAGHVGQRVRWARGMIQILRTDNPLLAKGMKLTQRLCYFNAMMHFMYAVPRLIFLLAPLAYMLAGRTIIPGYWLAILAYALPHLIISNMTNSRVQGTHRHSFWNEIYETVLAPYILLPTVLALINPKLGSFNVTDKGTTLNETKFDRKIAAPTTWLLGLNFLGVLAAPYRFFVLDPTHPGVVLSNLFWILFNVVILGVAAAVAHEQKQRRASVRIPVHIPVVGTTSAGTQVHGMTEDMSVGGASLTLSGDLPELQPGEYVHLTFPVQTGNRSVRATVIRLSSGKLRAQFTGLTIEEEETLTCALYSRADSWVNVRSNVEQDRPFVSLGRIAVLSLTGLKQVALGLLPEKRTPPPVPSRVASMLVFALLSLAGLRMGAQTPAMPMVPPAVMTPMSAGMTPVMDVRGPEPTHLRFKDMGVADEAELRGPHSYYSLHFILPHTLLPRTATLSIGYRFSTELSRAATASIRVSLNKTLIATITPDTEAMHTGRYNVLPITVPTDLLIRDNELTMEFIGNGVLRTSGKSQAEVLARIANASELVVSGAALPFRTDISLLPLPLFDSDMQGTTTIPFVFPTQPDAKTMQAAGIVASWFGILASNKPIRFRVVMGAVPAGNAVVFVNKASRQAFLPATSPGASLQLSPNPSDPDGTALIVSGDNGDQLIQAARALSLRASHVDTGEPQELLGNVLRVDNFSMPAARTIDDAPRWVPTDRLVQLSKYITQNAETTDGSRPVPVYFRVPPDLYYGETENLNLLIRYRYDARAAAEGSALRTFINGTLINEAPLEPGGGKTTDGQRQTLLPVANMRPFTNTLQFNFDFVPARGAAGALTKGSILKNSSLDLRNLNHWAQLPNLELFANAGFPFTQLADLGRTVVILPRQPSNAEITLFLDMLAHFSRQTGYPALRVEVSGPDDLVREDRDYLILGGYSTQPAFAALRDNLPIAVDADGVHAKAMDTYLTRAQRWWYQITRQTLPDQDFARDTGLADSVIEGIQSPYATDRSLVAVAMRDDSVEPMFADLFLERSQSSDISRTVSVLRGNRFLSYDLNVARYHVGNISWYTGMRIWLTQYFFILLIGVALCAMILSRWLRDSLQKRADERLSSAKNEAHALV